MVGRGKKLGNVQQICQFGDEKLGAFLAEPTGNFVVLIFVVLTCAVPAWNHSLCKM